MTQRQRKALGIVLTLATLLVWSVLGMWAYETFMVGANSLIHLMFFVCFGMAWVLPAMVVIRWMARPD